jgi:hypothetical protein
MDFPSRATAITKIKKVYIPLIYIDNITDMIYKKKIDNMRLNCCLHEKWERESVR